MSVLGDVEPMQWLAWRGEANGILGIHVWTFSPHQSGTVVATEESWEGAALPSNLAELQQALDSALARWLSFLKAHVAG